MLDQKFGILENIGDTYRKISDRLKSLLKDESTVNISRRDFIKYSVVAIAAFTLNSKPNYEINPKTETLINPEIESLKPRRFVLDFGNGKEIAGFDYLNDEFAGFENFLKILTQEDLLESGNNDRTNFSLSDFDNPQKLATYINSKISEKFENHLSECNAAFGNDSENATLIPLQSFLKNVEVSYDHKDNSANIIYEFDINAICKTIKNLNLSSRDVLGMSMQLSKIRIKIKKDEFYSSISDNEYYKFGISNKILIPDLEKPNWFKNLLPYKSNSVIMSSKIVDENNPVEVAEAKRIDENNKASIEANKENDTINSYTLINADGSSDNFLSNVQLADILNAKYISSTELSHTIEINGSIYNLVLTNGELHNNNKELIPKYYRFDLTGIVGAYDEKNNPDASSNISDLIKLANSTNATLIAAGGNASDNFKNIRASYEKEFSWPRNLIVVGMTRLNGQYDDKSRRKSQLQDNEGKVTTTITEEIITQGLTFAGFGPDIFVDLESFGFREFTSFATKLVERKVKNLFKANPEIKTMPIVRLKRLLKLREFLIGMPTSSETKVGENAIYASVITAREFNVRRN